MWVVCYEPPSRRTRHKFNPFFCNSIYFQSSFAAMCWKYDACKYTIDMAIAISSSMATITAIVIPTTTITTTSTNRLNTFSLLTIFEFYYRHWLWVGFLIASFWSMCHEKRTTQLLKWLIFSFDKNIWHSTMNLHCFLKQSKVFVCKIGNLQGVWKNEMVHTYTHTYTQSQHITSQFNTVSLCSPYKNG